MSEPYFDCDVAIVGYGPTGVSAANFLGSRGVSAIALERYTDIYARARAVTVNDWTMRLYQSVGLDDALKQGMDETHSFRWITYDGTELRRVAFGAGTMGHPVSYGIYQPIMEQTLRDGAARYADHVEIRFGVDATDIAQDADGVTIATTNVETGAVSTVRARYVLACDGGSSRTREQLGIALLGETAETKWVVIDAKVKRWWPNRHILTFWSDKDRPVVDIALARGNHRWELPLAAHESETDFQTHEQLWRLLGTMGVTSDNVEIHQHAFYNHHVRAAERWRDRRVLLVGDSAHLMPPWAGQGMQSGIRDAYNLSWKLAEILAGRLPDTILDSYQAERAPDVAYWTQTAIALGRIIKRELTDAELAAQRSGGQARPMVREPAVATGWLTGATGDGSAVGRMIPQPRVVATNGQAALLDVLIGNGFTLLGDDIDPASLLSADEKAAWDALGASYRRILTPDQPSTAASDLIDVEGSLIGWMRQYGARALALRPDRFVAAASPGSLAVPVIA